MRTGCTGFRVARDRICRVGLLSALAEAKHMKCISLLTAKKSSPSPLLYVSVS